MKWTGKIIGSIIGALFGSPITVIIGLAVGHLFDSGLIQKWIGVTSFAKAQAGRVQDVFFDSTFKIMGHVAKSDGRVSENEIQAARRVMDQMGLDEQMRREAIHLFNLGKQPEFDLDSALHQLKQVCWYRPSLLRIFLEIQVQMAYADGQSISAAKRAKLQYICQRLGVVGLNFSYFDQRYHAEQDYQRSYQTPGYDPRSHLDEAYRLLGVSATASDAEVKKAYRRLMSQHHPDKLIAKGLPPEMIKVATQKTQQIKKAYEQICQARGLK